MGPRLISYVLSSSSCSFWRVPLTDILLKTIMAGPNGVIQPGEVDLPDERAKQLIESGHAEVVESFRVAPLETATYGALEISTMPKSDPRQASVSDIPTNATTSATDAPVESSS